MPKIQEYLPEENASGPVGGIAPNLDQVGMFGRGLQTFGEDTGQAVDLLNRRQEQLEVSQASATLSEMRASANDAIAQQTNDGTLDVDSFKKKYQDQIDQESQNYTTPGGKDYFNKISARIGASLVQRASQGAAIVAANNAKSSFQTQLNSDSDSLMSDPTQFADIHDQGMQTIQAYIDAGTLKPADAAKMQAFFGAEISKGAVRGWASMDPKKAKQMLDAGGFDQYLDSDQKKAMYGEVRQAQTASDIETERSIKLAKDAQAEKFEDWEQQALPKLVKNGVSTKDILSSPGTAEQKYRWLGMVKAQAQEQTKTDPTVYNNLVSRMHLPPSDPRAITDPAQLSDSVGKGISTSDYTSLYNWFDKTPQGQAMNANRKALLETAKEQLVKAQPFSQPDPDGQYHLSQFTNALQQAEASMRKQKIPVSELYDTTSKYYFGNANISKFKRTPEQILSSQVQQNNGNYIPPANIQTGPGQTPNYSAPGTTLTPKRMAGESPAAFLKRTGGGK